MTKKVRVLGTDISIHPQKKEDYISLTDIARYKNADEPKDVVKNWLRNKDTIEFLGLWERINNLNFKGVEFDSFRARAGSNAFVLSPQRWIEKPMLLASFQNPAKTAEPLPTRILPLSSHRGFLLNSSFI